MATIGRSISWCQLMELHFVVDIYQLDRLTFSSKRVIISNRKWPRQFNSIQFLFRVDTFGNVINNISFKLLHRFKLLLRLAHGIENIMLNATFQTMRSDKNTRLQNVQYILLTNGLGNVWHNPEIWEKDQLKHTLDDSHCTATSEVVQAIKSVKETIEDCI